MGVMFFLLIILACLPFYFIRVVTGPTIWDRLHSLNLISVKILLFIILFASHLEASYLLDIAIVYALLGFISTLFTAIFFLERIRKLKGGDD